MAPKTETVSLARWAKSWGITPRRAQQFIQDGMPHRMRETVTEVVEREANAWRLERAIAEATKGSDEKHQQLRRVRAEADLKESEVRERLGELVPRDEWEKFQESMIGGFAAVAMGQLQRFEREMVRTTSAGEARLLTQKMQAALMEGAQSFADRLEAEALTIELEKEQGTGS